MQFCLDSIFLHRYPLVAQACAIISVEKKAKLHYLCYYSGYWSLWKILVAVLGYDACISGYPSKEDCGLHGEWKNFSMVSS